MNCILTNDDGVDAPGLRALSEVLDGDTVIVAPSGPLSGCSHRVTTHEGPIRVNQLRRGVYAVEGTPADCARLGLRHFHRGADAVLSGINPGGNLGADLYLSGTVAAAREAAFLGVRGIALSHYVKPGLPIDWSRASRWARRVIDELLSRDDHDGAFFNVNLPHLAATAPDPDIVYCDPCKQPLPVDYRVEGDEYH